MTDFEKNCILLQFPDADLSIIKKVIYHDSVSDFEEYDGYLIFEGIDGSIQIVEFGYCVMIDDNSNLFSPREITMENANKLIDEMKNRIKNNEHLFRF